MGELTMAHQLSNEDVVHVAKLSRLKLTEDELQHFGEQLSSVLGYVSKLSELDVEGVEPMAHALDVTNVLREDVPVEGMSNEQALMNAPRQADGFFRVPEILGEGSGA